MKTIKLILIISSLALVGGASAAEPLPAFPAISAPSATTVNVPTIASELATGYAAAVQQMSLKGLVIFCQREKGVTPIKGIRSVRAVAGVLLLTFSAGDMMAVSAERVIMITDGTRTP